MDLKKAVHCDSNNLLLLLNLSEAVEFRDRHYTVLPGVTPTNVCKCFAV